LYVPYSSFPSILSREMIFLEGYAWIGFVLKTKVVHHTMFKLSRLLHLFIASIGFLEVFLNLDW